LYELGTTTLDVRGVLIVPAPAVEEAEEGVALSHCVGDVALAAEVVDASGVGARHGAVERVVTNCLSLPNYLVYPALHKVWLPVPTRKSVERRLLEDVSSGSGVCQRPALDRA
jgi:hypothetical protein